MSAHRKRPRTALLAFICTTTIFALSGCGPTDCDYPCNSQANAPNAEQSTSLVAIPSTDTKQASSIAVRVTRHADAYLVSWNSVEQEFVGGYVVYRDGVRILRVMPDTTAYVDLGAPGTHTYAVAAIRGLDGTEGPRSPEAVTPEM